ncbi:MULTISPECIES: alpha/beta fold hydrolase [unclassified Streptomyces]|uniref:alpha/beta fold hydrolase n=1 Tax=unclassified Streptomyces TaxID=2593676 RepID=UPI00093A5860|nr:alpha/beta hydrolase [Streptomyces sp. TSRI0281]OKI45815.1 hypothetical protein A6A29_29985 [Streptomyces sp. TSRI0281]
MAAVYDIIGMDTRGLGRSTPVDCGLTRGTWLHAPGADRAGFDQSVRLSRMDARRCWDKHPDVLPHLSTRNIARDVDIVRSVLGERRTSLFGQSYGTVLGSTFAQMFPRRVDRLVLDSAPIPPSTRSAWCDARDPPMRRRSTTSRPGPHSGTASTDSAARPPRYVPA